MSATFDWNRATPKKDAMSKSECNKDTQIDFNFPQQASGKITVVKPTTDSYYTLSSNSVNDQITLRFLNRDGVNATYKLSDISLGGLSNTRVNIQNTPLTVAGPPAVNYLTSELSLTYLNEKKDQSVVVSIYLIDNYTPSANSKEQPFIIKSTSTQTTGFREFIKGFNSQPDKLNNIAALTLFNSMDFGMFFTQVEAANSDGCKINYLINRFVYQIGDANLSANTSYTGYIQSTTNNQVATGDFLCYGSNTNLGTFQTHMRDNYALWAGWISVFIFWIGLLYGDSTTINCFDKKFEENKMTCWSYYSLFHLAHEEFFTRMLRMVPLYMGFCWQGCVVAILYSHIGHIYTDATTIPWFAVIAWACSIPLQYFYGFFTNRIYAKTLQKYNQKKKIKALFDKDGSDRQTFEENIDNCEVSIFTTYYWMYIMSFVFFITFWTLAINRLQQIPRQRYDTQNKYFVGALLVAWAFDVFIVEPLVALILGNTSLVRFKAYFYNYKLGEVFKELEA